MNTTCRCHGKVKKQMWILQETIVMPPLNAAETNFKSHKTKELEII